MINLPIQFADSEPAACTPLAAKASTVGGPSLGVGFGGASLPLNTREQIPLLVKRAMIVHAEDRDPTPDELAGITWWNNLTEAERRQALFSADTNRASVAWNHYKKEQRQQPARPVPTDPTDPLRQIPLLVVFAQ